jgi:hypothetical protein
VATMEGSTGAGSTAPPGSVHTEEAPAEARHGAASELSEAPNGEAPGVRGNTAESVEHAIATEAHPSEPQSEGGLNPPDIDDR